MSIELYPKENLIQLPDLTLQLNELDKLEKTTKTQHPIRTAEKTTIAPNQQFILNC